MRKSRKRTNTSLYRNWSPTELGRFLVVQYIDYIFFRYEFWVRPKTGLRMCVLLIRCICTTKSHWLTTTLMTTKSRKTPEHGFLVASVSLSPEATLNPSLFFFLSFFFRRRFFENQKSCIQKVIMRSHVIFNDNFSFLGRFWWFFHFWTDFDDFSHFWVNFDDFFSFWCRSACLVIIFHFLADFDDFFYFSADFDDFSHFWVNFDDFLISGTQKLISWKKWNCSQWTVTRWGDILFK